MAALRGIILVGSDSVVRFFLCFRPKLLIRSTIGVEEDCGGDPSFGDESVGTSGTVDGGVEDDSVDGASGSVDGVVGSTCSVGGVSRLVDCSDLVDDADEGTGEGTREGIGEGAGEGTREATGEGAGEGADEFALTVSLRDLNSSVSEESPLDDALL